VEEESTIGYSRPAAVSHPDHSPGP